MEIRNCQITKLPKIYYSSWGEGFFSRVWINNNNCWMYSVLKFIEANIHFKNDRDVLPVFEKICASDFPFMHRNKEQQKFAEGQFKSYLAEIMESITLSEKEVISAFPVDPFWCYFTYVKKLDAPTEYNDLEDVKFIIHKLGHTDNKSGARKNNIITAVKLSDENFVIYYQYFLLYPNLYYSFSVKDKNLSTTFKMPEPGIPVYINDGLYDNYSYNYDKLTEKLMELWGFAEELPPLMYDNKGSKKCIYTIEHLKQVLPKDVKAAVYKYNKESYSLLRFKDLSLLNPVVIFDDKIFCDDAADYINIPSTLIPVINNIDEIDKKDFNVIVFTCNVNFESELVIVEKLVGKALDKGFPVILLYDDIFKLDHFQDLLNDGNTNNLYKIGLHKEDFKELDIEKYNQYKPGKVLGIFGTDTVQGKFTTQIILREELKKYMRVKHFATEPTGVLVGADVSFSRIEEQNELKSTAYHRKIIEDLEAKCDIIITGGQNSIIFDQFNDGDLTKNVSTRIYKTFLPKWIILTISVDTNIDIITQSLEYISSINEKYNNNAEVIAFVMLVGRKIYGSRWTETYFTNIDDDIVEIKKKKVEEVTGIKVYVVPDEIKSLAKIVSNL
ncbi:MAG: DUF1611 domain-containing protein [Ignavibacteria bacterium]|jgi:1,4-alpha-glucan branching enzyme